MPNLLSCVSKFPQINPPSPLCQPGRQNSRKRGKELSLAEAPAAASSSFRLRFIKLWRDKMAGQAEKRRESKPFNYKTKNTFLFIFLSVFAGSSDPKGSGRET